MFKSVFPILPFSASTLAQDAVLRQVRFFTLTRGLAVLACTGITLGSSPVLAPRMALAAPVVAPVGPEAPAGQPVPSPAFGVPGTSTPGGYLLGPGDVLSVSVEGQTQYSFDAVPVSPDGKISLTFYGSYTVNKLTLKQVQAQLLAKLRQRMRNPQLTVSLVRPRPVDFYAVYVLGNGVRAPGVVQIQPNFRITEALAKAGGLTGNAEDSQATLTRDKAAPRSVDLPALLEKPSSAANVRLTPNDVLTITLVEPKRLTIDGDVERPGVYLLRRFPAPGASELPLDARLRDALIAAGNLKAPRAAIARPTGEGTAPAEPLAPPRFTGYILRGTQRLPLNLDGLSDYSDPAANVALRANDYVRVEVIPPTRVVIQGLVKQSGEVLLPVGATVIDAIASAGGLSQTPDKVVVTVSRAGKIMPVDLNRALLLNDPLANVKLQSGDNILVSEPATIQVTLSGEFARPDVVKLAPGTALLDAIAGAGGLKVDPDNARLSLLRTLVGGRQSVLSIDAVGLFRRNDLTQNVRLQDGDVVNVASVQRSTVYVMGEVATVGVQQISEKEGLAEIIAKAGGPTRKAALTGVLVQRAGQTQVVDTYSAIKEGAALNFALQDGDYIVVPPIKNQVMVMEAVAHPDFYPIPEKGQLTVLSAITMAGGATADAKVRQIAVLRPTPAGVETHLLSLSDIQKGDWTANTPLQAGDVVYVPRKDLNSQTLSQVQRGLGALLLVPRLLNGF